MSGKKTTAKAKEADASRAAEAVAEEAPSTRDSAPEGPAGGVGSALKARLASSPVCCECFTTEDLVTVGSGDAQRNYCPKHKPINA